MPSSVEINSLKSSEKSVIACGSAPCDNKLHKQELKVLEV